jgi:hypothetical protein
VAGAATLPRLRARVTAQAMMTSGILVFAASGASHYGDLRIGRCQARQWSGHAVSLRLRSDANGPSGS